MRACVSESEWVSNLTNTSWWLTAWAKEKEAWISKESLVSPEQPVMCIPMPMYMPSNCYYAIHIVHT